MITKVAVTAWKLMMPYLGTDSQHIIAKNIRKPLAEYNKGVAVGTKNIAKKYNIDINSFTADNDFNEVLRGFMGDRIGLGAFTLNSKPVVDKAYKALNDPGFKKEFKRQLIAELHSVQPYKKLLQNVNNARRENYSSIFAATLKNKPVPQYMYNTIMRHELSEGKHMLDALKNNVLLTRPQTPTKAMGHASLDVLKDEYKDILRSGYSDIQFNNNKLSLPLLKARAMDGEMAGLLRAGKSYKGDILGGPLYRGDKTTGDVKRMQTKFFNNLSKTQKRKDSAYAQIRRQQHDTAPVTRDMLMHQAPEYYI